MRKHLVTWMCWCTVFSLTASVWGQAATQPAAAAPAAAVKASGDVGYVKGNNVYVRSGFDMNYYPVTKLNRGDEVRILKEEHGWLEIAPPAGTYSLIDKTFVDKADDKAGTVNQTTWTYAGSNLGNQRYAKQVKLNQGDRVQLLGETSDGALYKIQPPAGATLWIKAELVDRSGTPLSATGDAKAPTLEPVKPGSLNLGSDGVPTSSPAGSSALAAKPAPRQAPPAPKERKDTDRYSLQINAIEAEIAAETAKPLGERQFEPIIVKLEPIAAQSEDEVSQVYAQTRIEQLRGHLELVGAVRQIRDLHDTAIESANQEARRRQGIIVEQAAPMDTVDLRGEIRVSGIYTGELNRPKRWRVVEPSGGKTQAYIEVPEGSPIDPVQYYGKYVGIRASGYRYLKGTIPPVPVYTVQEILVLDPASRATFSASPAPPAVAAPASQPGSAEAPADETSK